MAIGSSQRIRLVSPGAILSETTRGLRSMSARVTELSADGCTLQVRSQMLSGDSGRMRADALGEVWFPVRVTRVRRSTPADWTVTVQFDRLTDEKHQLVQELILRENRRVLEQFATKRSVGSGTVPSA